jgi:hypothetical protein
MKDGHKRYQVNRITQKQIAAIFEFGWNLVELA